MQMEADDQSSGETLQAEPVPIQKLEDQGIPNSDIQKLSNEGFKTIQSILFTPKKALILIKGLSEAKVDKIINAAYKIIPLAFQSASNFYLVRKNIARIKTGAKTLDNILGGGFESNAITEIYGEFRTGKTQICHTLCVTCQLSKDEGGGEGKAMYIDTEGTFRPERIIDIAEAMGLDGQSVLENVAYARAQSSDQQNDLLVQSVALMCESKFALLVVDSATALYRSEYLGRGELSVRQQQLSKFMRNLQKIADQFNVAVVITNQVQSSVDGTASFMGDVKKPIGGNILAHASTVRLQLRKGRQESRICKIIDSPNLPGAEASYQIAKEGIIDCND